MPMTGPVRSSIARPAAQPLTVHIQDWPVNAEAPRRWTESSSQVKGPTLHTVTHLRPNAIYELNANGQLAAALRSDKTGRVQFAYKRGHALAQQFELGLATPR